MSTAPSSSGKTTMAPTRAPQRSAMSWTSCLASPAQWLAPGVGRLARVLPPWACLVTLPWLISPLVPGRDTGRAGQPRLALLERASLQGALQLAPLLVWPILTASKAPVM